MARREKNSSRCAEMLVDICSILLSRINRLPDELSRELISGALKWTISKPNEVSYGIANNDTDLQIPPNLIGFQQVLHSICQESEARKKSVHRIIVDRQSQFNSAQAELAGWYNNLRGHKTELWGQVCLHLITLTCRRFLRPLSRVVIVRDLN